MTETGRTIGCRVDTAGDGRAPERAVLLLRAIANLRYREIAETVEIPIGSVMAYLAQGDWVWQCPWARP